MKYSLISSFPIFSIFRQNQNSVMECSYILTKDFQKREEAAAAGTNFLQIYGSCLTVSSLLLGKKQWNIDISYI
ncbi:MAG TPA: hypothetical protein DEQ14_04155 [Treponema sp.]|nr:hypothetical protein [Treponema sp.]